jgi:hypothetical protein
MHAIAQAMSHLEELDEAARARVLSWMVSRWGPFPGAQAPVSRADASEYYAGQEVEVDLSRPGRKLRQATGMLEDGTLVVVEDAEHLLGETVRAVVKTVRPTSRGAMLFARVAGSE